MPSAYRRDPIDERVRPDIICDASRLHDRLSQRVELDMGIVPRLRGPVATPKHGSAAYSIAGIFGTRTGSLPLDADRVRVKRQLSERKEPAESRNRLVSIPSFGSCVADSTYLMMSGCSREAGRA